MRVSHPHPEPALSRLGSCSQCSPCLPFNSGRVARMGGHPLPTLHHLRCSCHKKEPQRLPDTMGRRAHSPLPILAPQGSFLPAVQTLVCQTCTESMYFPLLPHKPCSQISPDTAKWQCPQASEIITFKSGKAI